MDNFPIFKDMRVILNFSEYPDNNYKILIGHQHHYNSPFIDVVTLTEEDVECSNIEQLLDDSIRLYGKHDKEYIRWVRKQKLNRVKKSNKSYQHFFNNVMIRLGYYDWSINFTTDSYCWLKQKKIDVNMNYTGDLRQIMLHEIAHIETAKFCNQKHNPQFWKRLEYLTIKFLKKEIDKYQIKHKEYMSTGIYSLIYSYD